MSVKKENVLLIVVDCLRADRTFGAGRSAHTPNLHALAEGGTLFANLITVNSMTIPCMTSVFSGLYPRNHGVRSMVGTRVPDNVPLLAEILQRNGYNTYAEATGPLSPFYRLNRGFAHYNLRNGVEESMLGEWGDRLIARFAGGEFVEPWFVYVHLWGVHRPRQVSPEYNSSEYGRTEYDRAITSYDARLGKLFEAVGEKAMILVTGDHGEKVPESDLETQVESLKKSFTRHSTKNSWLVQQRRKAIAFGRQSWFSAVRGLHRLGLVKDPLASLTGHGYHVYDSLVRVPLVLGGRKPAQQGQVVADQVRQVDLAPTILSLVGLSAEIPTGIDGRSLLPYLEGQSLPPLPAFIETCQNTRKPSDFYGVRADGWKYAFDAGNPRVPPELYDLQADPGETNNLAARNPQKAAAMRSLIEEQYLRQAQQTGAAMEEDLSEMDLQNLMSHLEKLGYVE